MAAAEPEWYVKKTRPLRDTEVPSSSAASEVSSKPPSAQPLKSPYVWDDARLRYTAALQKINLSPNLRDRFLELALDKAAFDFLSHCRSTHDQVTCSTWTTALLRPIFSKFMGHTDLNAFFLTGSMHLISSNHFQQLLGSAFPRIRDFVLPDAAGGAASKSSAQSTTAVTTPAPAPRAAPLDLDSGASAAAAAPPASAYARFRLLDVGAGNGRITSFMAPFFDSVKTTEVASQMAKRLRARGYECVETGLDTMAVDDVFDVVTCLNVLDRCLLPLTLLKQLRARLRDDSSRLLLAVPLPLNPSAEVGVKWLKPEESIVDPNSCACCEAKLPFAWEKAAVRLVDEYIVPAGFIVESISRLPYISEGTSTTPYFVLDDLILICRRGPVQAAVPLDLLSLYDTPPPPMPPLKDGEPAPASLSDLD